MSKKLDDRQHLGIEWYRTESQLGVGRVGQHMLFDKHGTYCDQVGIGGE